MHQLPEQHEHRYCQQNQAAHAFIHATDDDHYRRRGGRQQVGTGGDGKGEGNRCPGHDCCTQYADKEDRQCALAHRRQHWRAR